MKIKSIAIAICFAALISKPASSQSGIRLQAGVNLANVSVTSNGRVNDAHMLTSFQAGFIGDIHIASILYLQSGLLFTGKGSKVVSGDQNSNNYYKATSNPYYIELPANVLLKLPMGGDNRLFVGAGPYIAMGVSGKNKVDGNFNAVSFSSEKSIQYSNDDPTTLNYQEGAGFGILRRFDYGLNGTAGIEGKSLALGVNYGMGLSKIQSTGNSSADNNNKHRVFSIFLGIKL